MIAITVDDEYSALNQLTNAVSASDDIADVKEFSDGAAVLAYVADNRVDVAFLAICMRTTNGLSLAEKILELQPLCRIVFCTAHSEYALDAFRIHASGYLIKPITAEAVQSEIQHIKRRDKWDKLLQIHCFGTFEVYCHGAPLPFKRTKTKELLAYLVDRKGAGVTAKQICTQLWETDSQKNMNYFYQLLDDLRRTLKSVNAEAVLRKQGINYALDPGRVACDYYQYLAGVKQDFHGEYMTQYSWAEDTCALLLSE